MSLSFTIFFELQVDFPFHFRPTSVVSAGRKTGKRKKSSKKKSPPVGPKVGPWLSKLHISDNGIDSHGVASKYAPVLCMRAVTK